MNAKPRYPKFDFLTPLARLVAGSLHIPSDKDTQGKPRDKPQYWFHIAISKTDLSNPAAPNQAILQQLGQIQQHAFDTYASTPYRDAIQTKIRSGPIGALIPQGFRAPYAWKIEDGDWPENAGKEGHAGHWILKFSGTFAPNVCDNSPAFNQLNGATIQLGSYVQVAASTEINGNFDDTAGIYMNYRFVRVIAAADGVTVPIIQAGINGAAAFGDQGYTGPLPAGVQPAAAGHMVGAYHGNPGVPAGWPQNQQPAYGTPAPQAAPSGPTAPGGVQMPPPPAQQQGGQVGVYTPGPAPAPGVPAGSVPAPAGAPAPTGYPAAQPMQAAPGYPTAYPSNPPAPGGIGPTEAAQQQYAQVQPHQAFVQGVQPPR